MPFVIDRRAFLRTALAAGFASRLHGEGAGPAQWALLSDLHCPEDPQNVYRGFYPHANLKKVAQQVVERKPRFCAVTGDLARLTGAPGDYRTLKDLLDPVVSRMPVAMTLGNHDHRQNFAEVFPDAPGVRPPIPRKQIVTVEWTDWRAVFLDSLLETNVTPGQLGTAQRKWLDEYIRADQRPALLFVHHDFRDSDGSLVDAAKFLEAIVPLTQVKAVFYGHSHEHHADLHHGIHLVNLPSTAYNFRAQDPVGWVEMTLSKTGAELVLRAHAGNTEQDGAKTTLRWR